MAVTEVKCMEIGCPPLETVILLLDEPDSLKNKLRIQKPLLEVTEGDVSAAAQRLLRGEQVECKCGEALLNSMLKKQKGLGLGEEKTAAAALVKEKLERAPETTTREDIETLMKADFDFGMNC